MLKNASTYYRHFFFLVDIYDPFAIFIQVIQQVFMAKEWVWNVCNEVRAKAHSRLEVKKALGALKEEHIKLANKLTIVGRERQSTLIGLKNAEA